MKPETEGGDAFVTNGFSNWKKKKRLQIHVGIHDSAHNQAWRKYEALMRPKQHITATIEKQSEQAKKNYQIHLTATIDCIRFLLRQGLAFCGNDETNDSVNQRNFLELLNFLAQHNEEIDRAFKIAHRNLKVIVPSIQKDIVRAAARETTKVIVDDLGDELFAVLVNEARDIFIKEQMSVCLREHRHDQTHERRGPASSSGMHDAMPRKSGQKAALLAWSMIATTRGGRICDGTTRWGAVRRRTLGDGDQQHRADGAVWCYTAVACKGKWRN
ncbi:uncharacterized protein LOC127746562 [Arachis duranensis]|uniref:Uncharacterized protein LOC127746562 n=1 Tax=Arachis duranensis TaxID=130453 RepID=A0A9C6WT16_ARADU|nr:uncharacterized protein LOC127746562 [Arachis duranensis]